MRVAGENVWINQAAGGTVARWILRFSGSETISKERLENCMTNEQVHRAVQHLCEQLHVAIRLKGTEALPPNARDFGFDVPAVKTVLLSGLRLAGVPMPIFNSDEALLKPFFDPLKLRRNWLALSFAKLREGISNACAQIRRHCCRSCLVDPDVLAGLRRGPSSRDCFLHVLSWDNKDPPEISRRRANSCLRSVPRLLIRNYPRQMFVSLCD
jgi:hypothetical protein